MARADKRVIQKEKAENTKSPNTVEDPNAYLTKNPVWAFQKCDLDYEKWSVKSCNSFYDDIVDKLRSYEGLTWAEIQSASGGKSKGTNNHFEFISDMTREAQKRAEQIHLDVDQLFSLRLTGEMRLYGILELGVFYIILYGLINIMKYIRAVNRGCQYDSSFFSGISKYLY